MFHCETMIWYLSLVEPFQVAGGLFFILEVDDAKEQKQLKVQPHHISEMEIWHKVSHCQGQENPFFSVKRKSDKPYFSHTTGAAALWDATGWACFGFKI